MKVNELFQHTQHTCPVCYDDVVGFNCIQLDHCVHYYCKPCFQDYIEHSIGAGAVNNLTCPDSSCSNVLSIHQILRGTDQETSDRFERIQLQKTLDGMADIVWCPKTTCNTPCIEDSDNLAECPTCTFAFCTICYDDWHPGIKCISPEVRIQLLKAKNASQRQHTQSRREQEQQLKLLQEQMSLAVIKKSTNQCPSCKMAVEKSAGCNKMTCSCGTKFCNQCNQDISEVGYEHFYSLSTCVLFDQEALIKWNQEMGNMGRNIALLGNAVEYQLGSKCPRCRQMNAKGHDGNNYLKCWACNTAFCYLCRGVVNKKGKGTKPHFGKGGCPQHGDGSIKSTR